MNSLLRINNLIKHEPSKQTSHKSKNWIEEKAKDWTCRRLAGMYIMPFLLKAEIARPICYVSTRSINVYYPWLEPKYCQLVNHYSILESLLRAAEWRILFASLLFHQWEPSQWTHQYSARVWLWYAQMRRCFGVDSSCLYICQSPEGLKNTSFVPITSWVPVVSSILEAQQCSWPEYRRRYHELTVRVTMQDA